MTQSTISLQPPTRPTATSTSVDPVSRIGIRYDVFKLELRDKLAHQLEGITPFGDGIVDEKPSSSSLPLHSNSKSSLANARRAKEDLRGMGPSRYLVLARNRKELRRATSPENVCCAGRKKDFLSLTRSEGGMSLL